MTVLAVLGFVLGLVIVSGLLFALAAVVFGRGEQLPAPPQDTSPVVLPADRPVDAADVEAVRLSVVLRGYRMLEVDWVLDHVAEALREKDRTIAALTERLADRPPAEPLPSGSKHDGSGGPRA